jgi:tetratricopeptide (TPR) repeat protein
MFDLFISYRHADIDAVRPVAQALRNEGLEVWLDENRIEDFASIQRSIEEGLTQSKALLAWYSVRYPESLACQWELTRAFIAGQQEGDARRRVLLINPEPANLHIHPIELRDALYRSAPENATQLQTTVAAITSHLKKLTGTLATVEHPSRPPWFGAVRGDGSNRFVGRLRELWAIHSGLWSAEVPVIKSGESRPLVRVTGMGGSGKSLSAEVYGIRFGAAYPGGVFWLRAFGHDAVQPKNPDERENLLGDQIISFAQQFAISTQGLSTAQLRAQLAERIDPSGPYLWVVDDLPSGMTWEKAQSWLAPSKLGCTLMTTRSEAFQWAGTQVVIGELDEPAALDLLTHTRKPANDAERNEARSLARDLGYHPLALELAAVAVQKRGFAEFRASLNAPSRDVMDFAAELLAAHGQSLPHRKKTNLNLSATLFQSIDGLPESAKDFLRLAAELAPVPIARQLAVDSLASAGNGDPAAAEDIADIAVASVVAQSLAREPTPGSYSVHTLVSRAVRRRDTNHVRRGQLREAAVMGLNNMLADDRVFDVRRHPELSDTIEHARTVLAAELSETGALAVPEAQLVDTLYLYNFVRGNYAEAQRFAQRLIDYGHTVLGDEHQHTLTFGLYLGRCLRERGDLSGSLAVHQRMSEIHRRTQGERHPDTLRSESDTSLTLYALGELAKARQLQEHVLQLRLEVLGERDPETLTAMNNLAITLSAQRELQRARKLEETALKLRREVLGPDHPETLQAISNLAEILRLEGNLTAAQAMGEQMLDLHTEQLDEEHPDRVFSMNNLAAARASEGDFTGARELFERVLNLRRRQLGDEHPLTLATMNSLAAVLIGQSQTAEASRLLEQSLDLCRRALGPTHPQTFTAAYHLAVSLVHMNDSSGRVRELLSEHLSPLVSCDPDSLPAELRDLQAKLAPLLASLAQNQSQPERKSWWRKFI